MTEHRYKMFIDAAAEPLPAIDSQEALDDLAESLVQVKAAAAMMDAEKDALLVESKRIVAQYKPAGDAFKKLESDIKAAIIQADIDNQLQYEALLAEGWIEEATKMKFTRPEVLQFRDKATPVVTDKDALVQYLIEGGFDKYIDLVVDTKALLADRETLGELPGFVVEKGYTLAVVTKKDDVGVHR